jgi:uracil-DNA glycosylase
MKLRTALRRILVDWEKDLPAAWQSAVIGTQLDWRSRTLEEGLARGEMIFPARKGKEFPGAPKGAHVFKAFENTDPQGVRAVILGQDPYPNPAWATGRAFEQGNLQRWPEDASQVAQSLRRLVQVLVSARTGDQSYVASDGSWGELVGRVRQSSVHLESPPELFDRLEHEGVLFLNTSLTIGVARGTGGRGVVHHQFALWAPLIHHVLSFLAARRSAHTVFLLFGRHAEAVFERSGARVAAQNAGTWKTGVYVVRHFHPAAITGAGATFLRPPNPFCVANEYLRRMGAKPVNW